MRREYSLQVLLCLIFCLVGTSFSRFIESNDCGGYSTCPATKPGLLNVHLICHTHDDVGWLKTVDQYYYGDKDDIQRAGVQYTLDSVVASLLKDSTRRFVYVESAFFWRWYKVQDDATKKDVQTLVSEGRLEFVNGGWCMNDEAAAMYTDIIDQMTLGMVYLKQEFGDCAVPKIGWQIDPFGHAREQASLFAQFGFDGLFISRLDYQDKDKRISDKRMEEIWNATNSQGIDSSLMTSVLYNFYNPPPGFCYDIFCTDTPIMDDPELENYNVDERVEAFLKFVNTQASAYTTNNIALTMGSDFMYLDANRWYKNLDKLIKYVNANKTAGVNVLYSTPSCYMNALNQANATWAVKSDDFFPYASDHHAFWTGYFTSRPALKRYIRIASNVLQACKQMDAIARLTPTDAGSVDQLERAQAVLQHHDAVTGTAKQLVTDDYAKRLSDGIDSCQKRIDSAYKKIVPLNASYPVPDQIFCDLSNVSYCQFTFQAESFVVNVYNPVGHVLTVPVRIPVPLNSSYQVNDEMGADITSQIVAVPDQVLNQPERGSSAGMKNDELVFVAKDVSSLGFKTYFVTKLNGSEGNSEKWRSNDGRNDNIVIKNFFVEVILDGQTGLLSLIHDVYSGINQPITQDFFFYKGHDSTVRASGAYIFRPEDNSPPTRISNDSTIKTYVQTGPVVSEVLQVFNDYVSQVIRLYQYDLTGIVELEWLVGPIPVGDKIGKEIVSKFKTNIESQGLFYTDSNGRQILERKRDYRPTWNLTTVEPTSANYYPVNGRMFIKDDFSMFSQLTVMTDRSQGGTSLNDGEVELMVHRRLLYDDGFGVGEALNEPGYDGKGLVVRGKHFLLVTPPAEARYRTLSQLLLYGPIVSFAANDLSPADYAKQFKTQSRGISADLPDGVQLVTLQQWLENDQFLVRLENYYEVEEQPSPNPYGYLSVDLQTLMPQSLTINSVQEMTLGANQLLSDKKRLSWNTDTKFPNGPPNQINGTVINLYPMQIRTFIVKVNA